MKKLLYVIMTIFIMGAMLQGCVLKNESVDNFHPS